MPRLYQKSVGCATYFGFHFEKIAATIGCIGLTMGFTGIFSCEFFSKTVLLEAPVFSKILPTYTRIVSS